MLNRLGKEINVYSKKIVNVNVGDTVFWKSVNPGHNVEFIKAEFLQG
jgi:plastocyanin